MTHVKIRFAKNAKDKWCRMLNVQSRFRENSGNTLVEVRSEQRFFIYLFFCAFEIPV